MTQKNMVQAINESLRLEMQRDDRPMQIAWQILNP